ncbi:hypothetical protein C1752_14307 [Acaryochloris thomasi RCC1774]|uniref:SnoaL-like domain-containing protein n=1 Tax=Acaryochloris thomasi RCC1774 TaxID=1764569 RepID=A0A2W1J6Z0_9CYAN|nr:nuclear transport factor 2 family protein [Acaryochloris thomasi]PZD70310.1 hypothetical protein C1752_14307 [Acaryochloris thomasi RCC1774]
MLQEHPNVALLKQLDPKDLSRDPNLFAPNFVWHFFNPHLPEVQGDYVGLEGLQYFFETLEAITQGTFEVEPISITPIGDELLVTHVQDRMTLDGRFVALDAVVVWRIVDGCIAEAWDIPSVYTEHPQTATRAAA